MASATSPAATLEAGQTRADSLAHAGQSGRPSQTGGFRRRWQESMANGANAGSKYGMEQGLLGTTRTQEHSSTPS
jgi:hypothetical protein